MGDEFIVYSTHELEIIKAALESDIIYQEKSSNADHPAFKDWLRDTEELLKKVSRELFERKTKLSYLK